MTNRDNVVFAEMRQRTSSCFGASAETVHEHNRQRLHRGRWDNGAPCRFDTIANKGDRPNACIDGIKNSF
jgi:Holliday junction resolvase-like predicted endonuclease